MNYVNALISYLASRLNTIVITAIQNPLGNAMFLLPNAEIIINKSIPWYHVINGNSACCNIIIRIKDNIVAYDAFHELVTKIIADIAQVQQGLTRTLVKLNTTHVLTILEYVSCNFKCLNNTILQGDLLINAFVDSI